MHDAQSRAELVDVIRQVRARWRAKLALRGAVVVVAGSLLALFLSARGLEAFKFSSPSIVAFRLVTFAVFAALALYWLLGPLMRRVSDAQVALYLEERDPSLQAAILSAVEATAASGDEAARPHSAALVEPARGAGRGALPRHRLRPDVRAVRRSAASWPPSRPSSPRRRSCSSSGPRICGTACRRSS